MAAAPSCRPPARPDGQAPRPRVAAALLGAAAGTLAVSVVVGVRLLPWLAGAHPPADPSPATQPCC